MVDEFGLVAIDATPLDRRAAGAKCASIVSDALAGTKKTKDAKMARFEFYGEGLPEIDLEELKGKLIVLEGTDGVGRSTHIGLLKQWLENHGHAVLDTGMTRSRSGRQAVKAG